MVRKMVFAPFLQTQTQMQHILEKVKVTVTKTEYYDTDDEEDSINFSGQFSEVKATVFYNNENIGLIEATLVDRQAIAEGDFHTVFDMHSGEMEWIGISLLENRYGRTRLQSLCRYDDPEFDFMYITDFEIEKQVDPKIDDSDIATAALYRFLRDPKYIKGELPSHLKGSTLEEVTWACSSAAVVMPLSRSQDVNTKTRRSKRLKTIKNEDIASVESSNYDRNFVDPFLRNGFFQDPAIIRNDRDNARILVSSYGHWNQTNMPLSQSEVETMQLISHEKQKPSGKELEILNYVDSLKSNKQLNALRSNILRLVREGGSIPKSMALHSACDKNNYQIVKLLIDICPIDQVPSLLCTKNSEGQTPLMVAANNAGGRLSIMGIDETNVIDLLLEIGSDRSITDSLGMTAYGYFRKRSKLHFDMTYLDCRNKLVVLESKLCPPEAGPTMVDLTEGRGFDTGLVDYKTEDKVSDREHGRGKYKGYYY